MKRARLILGLVTAAALGSTAFASEGPGRTDQLALAHIPPPPAMMLPGMRATTYSLTSAQPLPQPLITDVINVPNPFDSRKSGLKGQTQIVYRLDKDVPVTVTLYSLTGFRVRRWQFTAGQNGGREGVNYFSWDGTNEYGQKVSKGGYLAQIEINLPGAVVSVVRKIGVIH